MSVLVTGAGGFLGKALVKCLLAHGERRIRCFVRDRRECGLFEHLMRTYPGATIEVCCGDLTSRSDTKGILKDIGVVYHLAAAMKGSAADMFMNTVVASRNLLDELGPGGGARIVLASSFSVYGTSTLGPGAVLDESTPLECEPAKRDLYSQAKLRQELLFREYRQRYGFPLVVVRPGVVYGPGGPGMSNRVGISVLGLFLHMGRRNLLPLTYVDNCAEAFVVAAECGESGGDAYNAVDDDLPTAKEFLSMYRELVDRTAYVSVPFAMTRFLSVLVEGYSHYSKGQLPAFLTPYKSQCLWAGHSFTNKKLKSIGWKQIVPTQQGLKEHFLYLRKTREEEMAGWG